jgi:hypothetical protein
MVCDERKNGIENEFQTDLKNGDPNGGMLQKEMQSLCNFFFLKIVKIELANMIQIFFLQKEMPSVPIKHHFSYL